MLDIIVDGIAYGMVLPTLVNTRQYSCSQTTRQRNGSGMENSWCVSTGRIPGSARQAVWNLGTKGHQIAHRKRK